MEWPIKCKYCGQYMPLWGSLVEHLTRFANDDRHPDYLQEDQIEILVEGEEIR